MVSFRQAKNVKTVHGNIDPRSLKALAKLPGIKNIVPGVINWRKRTSSIQSGLYFQRLTDNSIKLALKGNMYVQDVYVMVADDFQLASLKPVILNPEKL
jgi:hypothetical protein